MSRPLPRPTKKPIPQRPAGVGRTAAAALKAEREFGRAAIAVQPAEVVKATFRPGTSPSASARKILALLLARAGAAWASGQWPEDGVFLFSRRELRASLRHGSTDRVEDHLHDFSSIELVTAVNFQGQAAVKIEPVVRYRIIAESTEPGAPIALAVSDTLREIIATSDTYARLQVPLMLALESRYAVTMYGICELLVGLKKPYEDMTLEQARMRFGVEGDAYGRTTDLMKKLRKAAEAVTLIAPFHVSVIPIRRTSLTGAEYLRGRGAAIEHIRLMVQPKTFEELMAAAREAGASKVGRKARREGRVERVLSAIVPQIEADKAAVKRKKAVEVAARIAREQDQIRRADARTALREAQHRAEMQGSDKKRTR